MRAAVLREFGVRVEVDEVSIPVPAAGEALVRVRATGLCATDVKAWSGALPGLALPRILGHEIAGELVDEHEDLEAGAPVACYIYDTCGECIACRSGSVTGCRASVRLGLERDGGLAEFVAVPSSQLIPLPDGVAFDRGAVTMDAVATVWSALLGAAQLRGDEHVLIIGIGGLGLNAVQVARANSAHVAAIDVNADKLEFALEAGAEIAVLPGQEQEIAAWSGGGVDVALEVSGSRDGFQAGAAALRPGGRIVCCGYQPGSEYGLDSVRLVSEQLNICGSRSATLAQSRAALEAVGRGIIVPHIDRRLALEQVQAGLDSLSAGEILGRLVIDV